jgi:hypothetical protein
MMNCYSIHNFMHWHKLKISTIQRRKVQALHSQVGEEHGFYAASRAFAMFHIIWRKKFIKYKHNT